MSSIGDYRRQDHQQRAAIDFNRPICAETAHTYSNSVRDANAQEAENKNKTQAHKAIRFNDVAPAIFSSRRITFSSDLMCLFDGNVEKSVSI
jgi:hypothetical protein